MCTFCLQALADGFNEKRKAGTAVAHGTGYGGSGFKFDTTEEEERRAARKVRPRPSAFTCSCHPGKQGLVQPFVLDVQCTLPSPCRSPFGNLFC